MAKAFFKFKKTREVLSPTRGTALSGGIDFYVPEDIDPLFIPGSSGIIIPSGIIVEIPKNYVLLLSPRSSLAKLGLRPGARVIDADYQGEIHLAMWNHSKKQIPILPGQKIVQGLLIPVPVVEIIEDDTIHTITSERGDGGFGSTGN